METNIEKKVKEADLHLQIQIIESNCIFCWRNRQVCRPPTHRRGITERPHDNIAVNQHFVYFTYSFVYLIGFQ